MVKIKAEILIERPVEDVFTFLAVDFLENLPKIEHTILMIKQITEGEVRKGTQFHLITAKSEGEQDASKSELIKDLDLDQLEPELREEVNEAFIEVTAFVKNKLLEIIRVSEVGNSERKFLEKFTFLNVNGSTNILYETRFDISNLHYTVNYSEKKPSKFFKFFASIFINRMLKFGIKTRLKDVKVVIEAEPFDGIS